MRGLVPPPQAGYSLGGQCAARHWEGDAGLLVVAEERRHAACRQESRHRARTHNTILGKTYVHVPGSHRCIVILCSQADNSACRALRWWAQCR